MQGENSTRVCIDDGGVIEFTSCAEVEVDLNHTRRGIFQVLPFHPEDSKQEMTTQDGVK